METDLRVKAEWHKDFNGGLIPVLEAPDGTMVKESAVIANFAVDFAPKGQGITLWPSEEKESDQAASFENAQHRLLMQKFDGLLMMSFWKPYMTAFKEEENQADLKANLA